MAAAAAALWLLCVWRHTSPAPVVLLLLLLLLLLLPLFTPPHACMHAFVEAAWALLPGTRTCSSTRRLPRRCACGACHSSSSRGLVGTPVAMSTRTWVSLQAASIYFEYAALEYVGGTLQLQ